MTLEGLPKFSKKEWSKLDILLNDEASVHILCKDVVDEDDKRMLEALGILQIWALCKRTQPTIVSWSPVLERVAHHYPSTKSVVNYLLAMFSNKEISSEVSKLLQENLGYLTASTIWLLQQDAFKKHKNQMVMRLKVSFTIFDCFDGKTG